MKIEIEYNNPTTTFNMINVIRLRNHLKQLADPEASKPEVGFNMACYSPRFAKAWGGDKSAHKCGTVCCIGGHAAMLGDYENKSFGDDPISLFSQRWLGLTAGEAAFLFGGGFSMRVMWDVRLEEAIECLDYMVAHGKMPEKFRPEKFDPLKIGFE